MNVCEKILLLLLNLLSTLLQKDFFPNPPDCGPFPAENGIPIRKQQNLTLKGSSIEVFFWAGIFMYVCCELGFRG